MRMIFAYASVLLVIGATSPTTLARLWTDSTGRYTVDADLVGFNDSKVILKRADHEMVAIPLDKFSEQDREFIQSKEAGEIARKSLAGDQTWTLRDGTKLVGRIVDFASRDMTLQRRRGRIYVNDRPLGNLPEFYQLLIPKIVAQFENLQRSDQASLEAWLIRQRGQAVTFHLDGVVLETENGDEYAVPLALFTDDDQKLLKGGWEEWLAARKGNDYSAQENNSFMLRSLAAERQRDQKVQRQIALMQLQLQAVQAGLTSLWEVTLYPTAGQGRPRWVVMPGRDSRQATAAALEQNPGYVAGPVRRVSG
jgi:SLA1 Homology Domain 1 (SHD1) protein